MLRQEKIVIQSISGVLEKMFCEWNSKKLRTEIFFYLADKPPRTIWLKVYLKDEANHSSSEEETIIAEEVFHEVLSRGFINHMPGHGSRVRFLLSTSGEKEYWRLKELSEKNAKK